jgi:hypothetical protein
MGSNNMKTELINAISTGNFYFAKQLLFTMPSESIVSFLIDLALETNLIGIYTFILFLLLEKESIFFHEVAISVLSVSMWEGANASAFLHARRIIEFAPTDITKKEDLLTYFGIPDCVMSQEEATSLAKEILTQDPTNVIALKTIAQIINKVN